MRDNKIKAARIVEAIKRGYPQEVIEQMLTGDYIPGGGRVRVRDLVNLRDTDEPSARCCAQTGNDIQSGPIYCGAPAVKQAADRNGGVVYVCSRHARQLEVAMSMEAQRRAALAQESLTSSTL